MRPLEGQLMRRTVRASICYLVGGVLLGFFMGGLVVFLIVDWGPGDTEKYLDYGALAGAAIGVALGVLATWMKVRSHPSN